MTERDPVDVLCEAAKAYIDAYDVWQTRFAFHRIHGWDGNLQTQPLDLAEMYDDTINALEVLHRATGRGPRPNYVTEARKQMD